MKCIRVIALGFVAGIGTGANAEAATPLDRPSPPPCCADGICYAHAGSHGYFQTRWRTWPGLSFAPMPTKQPAPTNPIPGFPAYETPAPEKEDLQAPPPTKSLSEKPAVETPLGTPPTNPLDTMTPREPAGTTPPTSRPGASQPFPGFPQPVLPQPMFPQPTGTQPTGTQPSVPRPATTPLGVFNPNGDFDPPPAPPSYAAQSSGPRLALQQNSVAETDWPAARATAPAKTSAARPRQRTDGDPPPPPPLAISSNTL
jgi:hypothetical protein